MLGREIVWRGDWVETGNWKDRDGDGDDGGDGGGDGLF